MPHGQVSQFLDFLINEPIWHRAAAPSGVSVIVPTPKDTLSTKIIAATHRLTGGKVDGNGAAKRKQGVHQASLLSSAVRVFGRAGQGQRGGMLPAKKKKAAEDIIKSAPSK